MSREASPPAGSSMQLLGMPIARITRHALVNHVFEKLADGRGGWIITANLDHLQRYCSDPEMPPLYAGADFIVADGAPLIWAARLQGTPCPDRVAGSDLVWLLAERTAREGRSLYLLGGKGGAAASAGARLRERWPELHIAGISSPWVRAVPTKAEIEAIRGQLAQVEPDIVYVGLGAPKQERVIAELRSLFPRTWWMGVGISLSFIAGDVQRAPLWMQRIGLEWIHRMVQEPRRLAARYLGNNLPFALKLLARSLLAR